MKMEGNVLGEGLASKNTFEMGETAGCVVGGGRQSACPQQKG